MDKLLLFIDGSVNTALNIGYGAYLAVDEHEFSTESFVPKINLKRFDDTSSTKLELQTLLWALAELEGIGKKIIVYTDSQNIIRLPGRRSVLEQNNYYSFKKKLLNNHVLYRRFYQIIDHLDCDLVKVQGHQPSGHKDDLDRLFALVDRASRKALKSEYL